MPHQFYKVLPLQHDEFFIMRKYKLKYYLQETCYSV